MFHSLLLTSSVGRFSCPDFRHVGLDTVAFSIAGSHNGFWCSSHSADWLLQHSMRAWLPTRHQQSSSPLDLSTSTPRLLCRGKLGRPVLLQLVMRLCLKTHASLVSGFTPMRVDITLCQLTSLTSGFVDLGHLCHLPDSLDQGGL